ncbi:MAG TPA: hypothetical protein VJX67_00320 [Blastocatellia bacterium]|nr:hypothetical protein [Blastocatellia bacterium]
MIRDVFGAIGKAAHRFFTNWRALAIFTALYLALLTAIYWFVATGEATVGQVLTTLILGIAAPLLFFVLQTMSASYMRSDAGAGRLLAAGLRDFWKLMAIAVPFALLGWLCIYLISKIPVSTAVDTTAMVRTVANRGAAPVNTNLPPVQWGASAVAALEIFIIAIVLPLAMAHVWISAVREGLPRAMKRIHRTVAHAFAPGSVLTYAMGLIAFGLIPYILVVNRTPAKSAWVDSGLVAARLIAAALLILCGWVVTVGALTVEQEARSLKAHPGVQ